MRGPYYTNILFIVFILLIGCSDKLPSSYSAKEIEGVVKDHSTQKTLIGVNVVILWPLRDDKGNASGYLKIMETKSFPNGHYSFPKWDAEPRPEGVELAIESPILLFHKRDYYPLVLNNHSKTNEQRRLSTRNSVWHNKKIDLKSTTSLDKKYVDGLESLLNYLDPLLRDKGCKWKQVGDTLMALHIDAQLLKRSGVESEMDPKVILLSDKEESERCNVRNYFPELLVKEQLKNSEVFGRVALDPYPKDREFDPGKYSKPLQFK